MAKPGQVLIIEPQNELKFRGPFNVPVTSYMKLTNPSDKKVFFKIKTTAPKKYCVRPNSGSIDSKSVVEIAICLQPFIYDPLEKNKHKFMVQTVIAPEGETNIDALWKDLQPDQLMDSKLKCVFEVPEGNATSTSFNSLGATASSPDTTDIVDDKSRGDSAKASPKNAATDVELQKAAAEVKQLREEESTLRQENLQLKEEILRIRRSAQLEGRGQGDHHDPYSPPIVAQSSYPPMFIIASIIIAILGIIIGKFFL